MSKYRSPVTLAVAFSSLVLLALTGARAEAASYPDSWDSNWPKTDFTKTSIDLGEIYSGGPANDGIPSIDDPTFLPVLEITDLGAQEPVIALHVNGLIHQN